MSVLELFLVQRQLLLRELKFLQYAVLCARLRSPNPVLQFIYALFIHRHTAFSLFDLRCESSRFGSDGRWEVFGIAKGGREGEVDQKIRQAESFLRIIAFAARHGQLGKLLRGFNGSRVHVSAACFRGFNGTAAKKRDSPTRA